MKLLTIILFFVFTCKNETLSQNSNNSIKTGIKLNDNKIDTIKRLKKVNHQRNIKFQEFEELARNEKQIPLNYIMKFVKYNDSILFENPAIFISKGVIFKKKYKLFILKHSGKNEENYVLITYNNILNKQIDVKKILSFKKKNTIETIVAELTFLTYSKYNEFELIYFNSKKSKAMPDIDNVKIKLKENWLVNTDGYFIKKSSVK